MSGDPAPLAQAFAARASLRVPLLRLLLAAREDAPVADCHALIWQGAGPDMPDAMAGLFSWYLREDARTRLPARAAIHRELLLRALPAGQLPQTAAGFELGFTAVRVLTGQPVSLHLHRQAGEALRALSDAWFAKGDRGPRPAMIYAALGTMDLDLIRLCIDRAGPTRPDDLRHAIEWGLNELMAAQGGPDDWLIRAIETAYALDPLSPGSVHGMLWLGLLRYQNFRTLAPMLHRMRLDLGEPRLKSVLLYALYKAETHEAGEEIPWIEDQLRALYPGWVQAEAESDEDGPEPPAPDPLAGPPRTLPQCITEARRLAASDLRLGATVSPAGLDQAFAGLVQAIGAAEVPTGWTLGDFLEAASVIRHLTTRQFGWVVHFVQAPHAGGRPQYGTVDLQFFPVLHFGLLRVAAAICRAGLSWIEAGHGAAGGWVLSGLVRTHTATALEADEIGLAQEVLDRLQASGVMPAVVAVERDNLRLRAGQTAAAQDDPPTARRGSSVHPYLPRADWSRAEAMTWEVLARDPGLRGRFDILWPDGTLRSYDHETPARDVLLADARGASLVAEGLIIGPKGTMLKPDPYHTSLNYPVEGLTVLAGQGRAVRIRPQARLRCDQPVLLLDALAVLHWPNYYHWMITHLSRIALAAEAGVLADRRLVLPAGMKRWMLESLDLIGLGETTRLIVPPSDLTRFGDARILSSVEHLSPAAIHALRRRVLGPRAEVLAPPQPGRVLYLSRRSRALRKLVNEDEIEAIAADMGFEVIAPEDYSIAEQRDIFAQARGIAAPEGAALSNMIFAAPGTRVLSILCENDMLPIFNDLALVLGQAHCKLPGAGLAATPAGTRFQPHYHIAPALARRALAWVLEANR